MPETRNVTKNKLQIIGQLHDSSAWSKPLVSLRRRALSTDTRRRRNQRRENIGRLVTPLKDRSECHALCAASVCGKEVRILDICSLLYSQVFSSLAFFSFDYLTILRRIYPPAENDLCVAVGTDEQQVTRSIFLQPILENCDKCYRCFIEAAEISKCPVSNFILLRFFLLKIISYKDIEAYITNQITFDIFTNFYCIFGLLYHSVTLVILIQYRSKIQCCNRI